MTQTPCDVCRQRSFKVDLLVKAFEECLEEMKFAIRYAGDYGISLDGLYSSVEDGRAAVKNMKGCNGC